MPASSLIVSSVSVSPRSCVTDIPCECDRCIPPSRYLLHTHHCPLLQLLLPCPPQHPKLRRTSRFHRRHLFPSVRRVYIRSPRLLHHAPYRNRHMHSTTHHPSTGHRTTSPSPHRYHPSLSIPHSAAPTRTRYATTVSTSLRPRAASSPCPRQPHLCPSRRPSFTRLRLNPYISCLNTVCPTV